MEIGSLGTSASSVMLSSSDESVSPLTKKERFYSIVNSVRVSVLDEINSNSLLFYPTFKPNRNRVHLVLVVE